MTDKNLQAVLDMSALAPLEKGKTGLIKGVTGGECIEGNQNNYSGKLIRWNYVPRD